MSVMRSLLLLALTLTLGASSALAQTNGMSEEQYQNYKMGLVRKHEESRRTGLQREETVAPVAGVPSDDTQSRRRASKNGCKSNTSANSSRIRCDDGSSFEVRAGGTKVTTKGEQGTKAYQYAMSDPATIMVLNGGNRDYAGTTGFKPATGGVATGAVGYDPQSPTVAQDQVDAVARTYQQQAGTVPGTDAQSTTDQLDDFKRRMGYQ